MVDDVDSRYVYCTCFERRVAQSSTVEPIAGNQQLYRNMGFNGLEHVEYTACWNPKLAKNFPTSLLLLLQSPTNCHLDCSFLWTFPRQKIENFWGRNIPEFRIPPSQSTKVALPIFRQVLIWQLHREGQQLSEMQGVKKHWCRVTKISPWKQMLIHRFFLSEFYASYQNLIYEMMFWIIYIVVILLGNLIAPTFSSPFGRPDLLVSAEAASLMAQSVCHFPFFFRAKMTFGATWGNGILKWLLKIEEAACCRCGQKILVSCEGTSHRMTDHEHW